MRTLIHSTRTRATINPRSTPVCRPFPRPVAALAALARRSRYSLPLGVAAIRLLPVGLGHCIFGLRGTYVGGLLS
jgi:hypothetical protein